VPVSISLPYPFVVRWGWRAVREDRGVWNSFTTVRNLTNLIVGTDRRLLAVIVGRRASRLRDKGYLTSQRVHILTWARSGPVGWRTALLVRFPLASLEFYFISILQATLWPVVDWASDRNEYKEYFIEVKAVGV
jgi:hypothetical protein